MKIQQRGSNELTQCDGGNQVCTADQSELPQYTIYLVLGDAVYL